MICQVVAYARFKTRQKFQKKTKTFSSKSGLQSLTRGGCLQEVPNTVIWMVFWKTGHWGEVVAYERWLQVEVWLCFTILVAQVMTSSLLICIIKSVNISKMKRSSPKKKPSFVVSKNLVGEGTCLSLLSFLPQYFC